jgi:prophage regulatory protein
VAEQIHTALTILRRKQVEARTGLSRSSIYARLRQNPKRPGDYDPTFPKPVSVGAKAVGWIEAEIEAWLTAQVAKSRGNHK